MGAGKTVIGKKLARALGLRFIDLDQYIESRYRVTINDLFQKYDEIVFRNIEHNLLKSVLKEENVLISTGGGTPCHFNNISLLKKAGFCIYIRLHPKSLYQRLVNSRKSRPLVKDLDQDSLLPFIQKKLEEREGVYLQSHLVVKGERITEKEIVGIIQNKPLNI